MKKIGEFISIITSLLLIFSKITPSITSNVNLLFIFEVISNLYFEFIFLFFIGILLILNKKTNLILLLKKYFKLYKISSSNTKNTLMIVFSLVLLLTSINSYQLIKAKGYYYKKHLLASSNIKVKLTKKAKDFESNKMFSEAINHYRDLIKINGGENNSFLNDKVLTLENRVKYSHTFYRLSLKEYNGRSKTITQKGLSLLLLSYKLNPNDINISNFILQISKTLTERIKALNFDNNKSDILNNEVLLKLLGNEMKKEISTGKYGRQNKIDSILVKNFIYSVDKTVLEKYIRNSWKYNELQTIKDTIANRVDG